MDDTEVRKGQVLSEYMVWSMGTIFITHLLFSPSGLFFCKNIIKTIDIGVQLEYNNIIN